MPQFLKNVNWTTVIVAVVIALLLDAFVFDRMG